MLNILIDAAICVKKFPNVVFVSSHTVILTVYNIQKLIVDVCNTNTRNINTIL